MDIPEIADHIISYIPRSCVAVCRSWYKACRTHILRDLYIDIATLKHIIACEDLETLRRIVTPDMGVTTALYLKRTSIMELALSPEQREMINHKLSWLVGQLFRATNGVVDLPWLVSIIPHDPKDDEKLVCDLVLLFDITHKYLISYVIKTEHNDSNYRLIHPLITHPQIDITANYNDLLRCCVDSRPELAVELLKQPRVNNLRNLIPTIVKYYGPTGKKIMEIAGISHIKVMLYAIQRYIIALENK